MLQDKSTSGCMHKTVGDPRLLVFHYVAGVVSPEAIEQFLCDQRLLAFHYVAGLECLYLDRSYDEINAYWHFIMLQVIKAATNS